MKLYWPQQIQLQDAVEIVQNTPTNQSFCEEVLAFIQSLSKRLIKLRHLPEVVALGYWLRKANIKTLQVQFEANHLQGAIRARGIAFHIAPSNVDTIFVYSWMLSLLAGNKNIIRLSTKANVNTLLQTIMEEMEKHQAVAKTTIICTYEHMEHYTELFSQICHTRVIWGGDETVQAIRKIPLKPLANELVFPDRFSLVVINSEKVNTLNEQELDTLLEQFYNDVFLFDQMACSSPRLVIWKGKSSHVFWSKFEQKIAQKQYKLAAVTQVMKYTATMQLATIENVQQVVPKTYFSRVKLQHVTDSIKDLHCGGGLFYEYELCNLMEVVAFLNDKDQTITYFGFEKKELIALAEGIQNRSVDRIVPIGQALNFDSVWDGQNFITSFTRIVQII